MRNLFRLLPRFATRYFSAPPRDRTENLLIKSPFRGAQEDTGSLYRTQGADPQVSAIETPKEATESHGLSHGLKRAIEWLLIPSPLDSFSDDLTYVKRMGA